MSISNEDIKVEWTPGDTLVISMDGDTDGTDGDSDGTDGDGTDGDTDGTDGDGGDADGGDA